MSGTPTQNDAGSSDQSTARTSWRVVLVTGAAVLLIFGSYEVVERIWLADWPMERLHLLHRLRGLFLALTAAAVVSWQLLRRSPSLLAASETASPLTVTRVTEDERIVRYASWFIRMRWVAALTALVIVVFAVYVVELLPAETWLSLLLTIAMLGSLNLTYGALLRARMGMRYLLPLQAYGDLAVLILLLHYSGGVENPLAMLFLFHVIIAGIVLSHRQCYWLAGAASTLFALLVLAEGTAFVPHYTLSAFPHFEGAGGIHHAAHDPTYAISGVLVQSAILFLTAYFTTTMTDRLHHHEAQLELFANRILEQSQLLEQALEMTGTGLCVCDRNLECQWSNVRWRSSMAGLLSGACGGIAMDDGSVPAQATLADAQIRRTELTLRGADSRDAVPTVLQLTTAPLLDQAGETTHVVQLSQDITAERQMQVRMAKAEKFAAIGELAGKMAHEINNPIAIISAKARLLISDERDALSGRTVDELKKIADLCDRVARVAQGLLSYSRPTAGPAALTDARIPLQKALSLIETTAAASGVQIEQDLPPVAAQVRVNSGEMEQVFMNLFLNALDAMPRGGVLRVGARTRHMPQWHDISILEITVADNGCGIPADIREHAFEPFVTTKEEGRGTGLGLSICLGLVRSNGGEIALESEPDGGTCVRLHFPLAEPVMEPVLHA